MNYDIHQFQKRLEAASEQIRKAESIPDENRLAILKFIDFCQGQGLAPATVIKHVVALRHIARFLSTIQKK